MIITRPFVLDLNPSPNASQDEWDAVVDEAVQHERRVKQWLKGDLSSDELEQSIREIGHDPDEYWDAVDHNLKCVIDHGVPVEGVTLLLPDYLVDDGP